MIEKAPKGLPRRSTRVIVVGTTPDYVARLDHRYPESLIFLTAVRFKGDPILKDMCASSLFFTSFEDIHETIEGLHRFLSRHRVHPGGVACFDCESLIHASRIASHFHLPFPSWEAVTRSRNKHEAKTIWARAGVPAPRSMITSSLGDTLDFYRAHGRDIVLKPLSGSGSELLFHCIKEGEVAEAVRVLSRELPRRRSNPLFQPLPDPATGNALDPCRLWVTEEYVSGEEFSCDFVLEEEKVTIIRETGKVRAPDKPFGSILAYTLPPRYPACFKRAELPALLKKTVHSLGFHWGYFMVDYIIRDGSPFVIEVTPRPGGDSIPDLLEHALGMDVLGTYLGFVRGRFGDLLKWAAPSGSFASVNLYSPREGKVLHIEPSRVLCEPHVKALCLKKKVGDCVVLPPSDYDNRLIGYCILEKAEDLDLVSESGRLLGLLELAFD